MTVYVLVDGLYYPGVFATKADADTANSHWLAYTGRKALVIPMLLGEFVLDKYEDSQR